MRSNHVPPSESAHLTNRKHRHAVQRDGILSILLTEHADILPLHKIVQLSQLAKGLYDLTTRRLLAWRVLRVIVANSPETLEGRLTGVISEASCYTHALTHQLLIDYKHYHLLLRYKQSIAHLPQCMDCPPPEWATGGSDNEELSSSSESWRTP